MAEITNLQVHEPGIVTLTLEPGDRPYEVRLDGWNRWRPVSEFSWYPPHLFLGSQEAPLREGLRTLQVTDDGGQTFDTAEFRVGAEEPEPQWTTNRTLRTVSDWGNNKLIEAFDGATITDQVVQGRPMIRFWLPGPQTGGGGRVELQTYHGEEGLTTAYDYSFLLPAATRLSTAYSDSKNTITQHHADEQGGYTGGVVVWPDGRIALRLKGGDELSGQGSHEYEYEATVEFGEYQRDTLHHVRIEHFWHREDGYARARLDDGTWEGVEGVPTWPIGQAVGAESDRIMYRHGWYPQGGIVQGNMELFTGELLLQTAA